MNITDMVNQSNVALGVYKREVTAIIDNARAEGRENLTPEEDARVESLFASMASTKAARAKYRGIATEDAVTDASMRGATVPSGAGTPAKRTASLTIGRDRSNSASREVDSFVYRGGSHNGQNAAVSRGESFGSHPLVQEYANARSDADRRIIDTAGGDFGQMLRSMTTSSVSAIVPTEWSNNIIDLARNKTVLFEAGATMVPMNDKIVKVGRLTTDASPAFKTEGSAVTPADMAFDNVTLTATSLSALCVATVEFVQDGINAGSLIMESLAKAMALQLDLVGLFGQLATGNEPQAGALASPNPMGLLQALINYNSGSNVLGSATNGTTLTSTAPYAEIINTLYKVKRGNEVPSAIISNDALAQIYDGLYSTTNQPLKKPDVVTAQPWLTTNAIPSFTAGSMTSVATDLFVGDFREMLIGQRMELNIRVLSERYAELGEVGFMAYWRGDVALARPGAFAAYRYLKGAA